MELNEKLLAKIKEGSEPFSFGNKELALDLTKFWQWGFSNILNNTTRGILAEFIVASALGFDTNPIREDWKPYDLETADKKRVEVKSAAYLQTWSQKKLSSISFGTKSTFFWDDMTNEYEKQKKRHADVYVFCLLHHKNKETVDPLNLDHWKFYVLSTKQLNQYSGSQNSISLKALKSLTSAVLYDELNEAIKSHAAKQNDEILPRKNSFIL
jgi:hypothetical protein